MSSVYLVIHEQLPTDAMHMDDCAGGEIIETVNTSIIAAYTTEAKAQAKAREYFFETLRFTDSGKSEQGGYHWSASGDNVEDCETMDEEVYVSQRQLCS